MTADDATPPAGRYAAFEGDTGTLVVYDTEQPEAWIASDTTLADLLDARRSPSRRE
jgi:hypothetical protein